MVKILIFFLQISAFVWLSKNFWILFFLTVPGHFMKYKTEIIKWHKSEDFRDFCFGVTIKKLLNFFFIDCFKSLHLPLLLLISMVVLFFCVIIISVSIKRNFLRLPSTILIVIRIYDEFLILFRTNCVSTLDCASPIGEGIFSVQPYWNFNVVCK